LIECFKTFYQVVSDEEVSNEIIDLQWLACRVLRVVFSLERNELDSLVFFS